MTQISKGFVEKVMVDLKKISLSLDCHYDKLDDGMSYLEARNVFISLNNELGKILESYNIKK